MDTLNFLKISVDGPLEVQATPAANSTSSGSISQEYMYTIIGIYAAIIIIVLLIVVIVLFNRLRRVFCPLKYRDEQDFFFSPNSPGELNQVVDMTMEDSDVPSDDSNYTNLSLDIGVTYDDPYGTDSDDTPPLYEHPPSYSDREYESVMSFRSNDRP